MNMCCSCGAVLGDATSTANACAWAGLRKLLHVLDTDARESAQRLVELKGPLFHLAPGTEEVSILCIL